MTDTSQPEAELEHRADCPGSIFGSAAYELERCQCRYGRPPLAPGIRLELTTANTIIPGDTIQSHWPNTGTPVSAVVTGRRWDGRLPLEILPGEHHYAGCRFDIDTTNPGGYSIGIIRLVTEPDHRTIHPGCYVDSHHGSYAVPMVIRLAQQHGMALTTEDEATLTLEENGGPDNYDAQPDHSEHLYSILEQAEEWLNTRSRPDDIHTWSWEQGDYGLYLIGTGEAEDCYSITGPIHETRIAYTEALTRRRRWAQAASREGFTLEQIAEHLDISRQRVAQLLAEH